MSRLELANESVAVLPKREVLWLRINTAKIYSSANAVQIGTLFSKATATSVVVVSQS